MMAKQMAKQKTEWSSMGRKERQTLNIIDMDESMDVEVLRMDNGQMEKMAG